MPEQQTHVIPAYRWFLLLLIGLVALANHYSRDVLGTLERQMESELTLTTREYDTLNSVFFAPNIFVPPIAGLLCQKQGAAASIVLFAAIAAVGHGVFAIAVIHKTFSWLVVGRGMIGVCYEALDTLPLPLLQPFFANEWAFVMGATIALENLGSVLTFLISPKIYQSQGLVTALVYGCAIGMSCLPASILAWKLDRSLVRFRGLDWAAIPLSDFDMLDDENSDDNSDTTANNIDNDPELSSNKSSSIKSQHPSTRIRPTASKPLPDFTVPMSSVVHPSPAAITNTISIPDTSALAIPPVPPAQQMRAMLQSKEFWLFTIGGTLTYSSVLPFLLVGSKHLQIAHDLSVVDADALMVLPSVFLAVCCPIVGGITDALKLTFECQMWILSRFLLLSPIGLVILALMPNVPVPLPLTLISAGWTAFNTLYWASSIFVYPEKLVAVSVGITGGIINLFVTAVFLSLEQFSPESALLVFAGLGLTSCLCLSLLTQCCGGRKPPQDIAVE